jgi:cysteine desulfurase
VTVKLPDWAYFDYASTTPCLVADAMAPYWATVYANAGSLHGPGYEARQAVDQAKTALHTAFNSHGGQWVFTSGATESNQLVLAGVLNQLNTQPACPRHMVISAVEHDAVAVPARQLCQQWGWQLTELPVEPETGMITPDSLDGYLQHHPAALVSLMHGNNEVGTLYPLAALSQVARRHGALFHTDAAQTAGKLPLNLGSDLGRGPDGLAVDYLTLSGHKCYGPKGIGALYLRNGSPLPIPMQTGGGQQAGLRGGTEPVPLIVGFAAAVTDSLAWYAQESLLAEAVMLLRDTVLADCPHAVWNGPWDPTHRVPGHAHFSFPGLKGDALVNQLGFKGFAVSSGSACHSQVIQPSAVVLALGRDAAASLGTLRITMGRHTTLDSVHQLAEAIVAVVTRLQRR